MNTCTPKVLIVGAGPGADDLITLRGLRALEQADVLVYAGSLVNKALLRHCPSACICHDSAALSLEQQVAIMSQAAHERKKVVRLHTGDPALYGAINEQIHALANLGVEVQIVPGVSSVFAAAASLGCELTHPECSQSVVLTRTPGRTPMPELEQASRFAATGATLVFFLSVSNLDSLRYELMEQGGLTADTPVAVVYRASWPDERIVRGTLSDIAAKVVEAGITRQALIIVGKALTATNSVSHLYHAGFSHGYRNNLASEDFYGHCAIYAFTDTGTQLANTLADALALPSHVFSSRPETANRIAKGGFAKLLADNWNRYDAHIIVGATGIAVRGLAPLLQDKGKDPAVLACSDKGSHVISLLSGHLGGANRLARRVARITAGQAVISTATDLHDMPAFDEVAAITKAIVLNTEALAPLNAALLHKKAIAFCGPQEIFERYFAHLEHVHLVTDLANMTQSYGVLWSDSASPYSPLPQGTSASILHICSKALVLGIGCKRHTEPKTLQHAAEAFLAQHNLVPEQVAAVASCDIKKDEEAIVQLAKTWQIPLRLYPATALDLVQVPNPSATVQAKVGTASVCEAASLLGAGYASCEPRRASLIVPKTVQVGMTFALAQQAHERNLADTAIHNLAQPTSASQGSVVVVGLGSGNPEQITPEVHKALHACDIVVGYNNYVKMIQHLIPDKPSIQNGMTGEVARCQKTLEAALNGHNVCMVCSGDPGILAMAGLLFELRARNARYADIPIHVLPGITAASLAAASLGAPLQNGFCLLSLSDLLVPQEEILRNVQTVAQSCLPVTLYNPAGKKRRDLLHKSLDIFRQQRGSSTLCALVRHAAKKKQYQWIGPLGEMPLHEVDMSTVLLIGGPHTVYHNGVMYEPRGYVAKYLDPTQGTPS